MDIKRILFPADFSEGSDKALPYAADMAKQYDSKLYMLYVIHDIVQGTGWYVPHVSLNEVYKDMEANAVKQLEKYGLEKLRGLKNVERIVIKGIPHDEILKFAKENKIDMIVMGTHGRKGLDRVIFGSTAARVVREASCPVLSVRQPEHKSKK